MSANYDLNGKVIFITGGANGIGKGWIEALLGRSSKVFFVDIEEDTGDSVYRAFSSRFGVENVKFSHLDVSDRNQFEEVFQKALDTFGHVDVIVNNAGIADEFNARRTMEVNFLGTVYGTEIAFEHMRADKGGKGGRIINTSSVGGLIDFLHLPLYCASKHAVRSYTSSMALQPNLDKLGVEFAVLCPDTVDTRIRNFDPTNVLHFEMLPSREESRLSEMSVSYVVEAFMKLVTLKTINGALYYVDKDSNCFVRMKFTKIDTFPKIM